MWREALFNTYHGQGEGALAIQSQASKSIEKFLTTINTPNSSQEFIHYDHSANKCILILSLVVARGIFFL